MSPKILLQHFEQISEALDAVPRLRRFIIDMAVRGKLLEQNQADEHASKLLKRIEVEKARLIKAGEIKSSDLLPMAKVDDFDFIIPAGWDHSRLGDIAACLDFKRVPINSTERLQRIEGKKPTELFPYYGATQQQGLIDDYLFDEEILLLGEDGVPFFDLLRPKAYIVSGKTWVNNHAHVFRGILISNRFLMHWLNVFDYSGLIAGATRAKLNQSKALEIPVPLPPLAEQHRIVAKVDELMKLCDELEAAQVKRERRRDRLVTSTLHGLNNGVANDENGETLSFEESGRFYFNYLPRFTTRPEHIQQLRISILNLAVRGKLVLQDPKDEPADDLLKRIKKEKKELTIQNKGGKKELSPISADDMQFDLPKNWAYCRLPQILDVGDSMRRGPFGSSITKSMFVPKSAMTTKVYEQKNAIRKDYSIGSYYINMSEYPSLENFLAGPGDIIISCAGTIGETYLLPKEAPKGIINQALLKLRLYKKAVDDRYFMLVFKASTKSRIEEDAKGTAMKNIGSIDYLKHKLLFPLPPFVEQHRILAKVDELMKLCDELESHITTTSTTRSKLLEATLNEALAV